MSFSRNSKNENLTKRMKKKMLQIRTDEFQLTLQTYWLLAPGEKVCERTMVLLRTKGDPRARRLSLSL